jgi:hypothetical protein
MHPTQPLRPHLQRLVLGGSRRLLQPLQLRATAYKRAGATAWPAAAAAPLLHLPGNRLRRLCRAVAGACSRVEEGCGQRDAKSQYSTRSVHDEQRRSLPLPPPGRLLLWGPRAHLQNTSAGRPLECSARTPNTCSLRRRSNRKSFFEGGKPCGRRAVDSRRLHNAGRKRSSQGREQPLRPCGQAPVLGPTQRRPP